MVRLWVLLGRQLGRFHVHRAPVTQTTAVSVPQARSRLQSQRIKLCGDSGAITIRWLLSDADGSETLV